jgi:branched-chain amino acid transport system substrate-binding protein
VTLTACGNSDSSGDKTADSGASAAPTGANAPKGSVIKIGNIASLSGSQASSSSQSGTVAPAWADWVNANGGISGHPVQIVSADDAGDPSKAQAAAKKLVEDDKVQAILVGSDNLMGAYSDYVIKAGVPLIAGTANAQDWYAKAGTFAAVTDVVSGQATQLMVAQKYGQAKKFADLYCAEVAACAEVLKIQKPIAEKLGLDYTSLAVSSTATSYTAQCLQLKQDGVDYAQLNFTTAAAVKFIQDCQAQGYNPTWGSSEQGIAPALLKVPNVTLYGPAYAFPSVLDTPSVDSFRQAMDKYAKDDNWHEGTASFAWTGLELLRAALADMGTAEPTSQSVMTALNTKIQNTDLDGLLANKVSFNGKPIGVMSRPCAFVVGIKDGKTVAPAGTETVCASAS